MNARALGFQSAMIKCASAWAGTLRDPAAVRARNMAIAAGLGGAVIGASGAAALMAAMKRRRALKQKR